VVSVLRRAEPAATEKSAADLRVVDVSSVRTRSRSSGALSGRSRRGVRVVLLRADEGPDPRPRGAHLFFEVLASEGQFHSEILREQVAVVQRSRISVDEREGRSRCDDEGADVGLLPLL